MMSSDFKQPPTFESRGCPFNVILQNYPVVFVDILLERMILGIIELL
jgi:hypothetical protein